MPRSESQHVHVMAAARVTVAGRRCPTDMVFLVVGTIALWNRRANERHRLSMLGCHALKDISLRRADVKRECAKPFWRA